MQVLLQFLSMRVLIRCMHVISYLIYSVSFFSLSSYFPPLLFLSFLPLSVPCNLFAEEIVYFPLKFPIVQICLILSPYSSLTCSCVLSVFHSWKFDQIYV
jgi:hypothetical protein